MYMFGEKILGKKRVSNDHSRSKWSQPLWTFRMTSWDSGHRDRSVSDGFIPSFKRNFGLVPEDQYDLKPSSSWKK